MADTDTNTDAETEPQSAAVILYLAQKYRGRVCEAHRANPARELTATGGPPRPS